MDSRTFIFGAVCGAAIYALIDTVLLPDRAMHSSEDGTVHTNQSAGTSQEPDQVTLQQMPQTETSTQSKLSETHEANSLVGQSQPEQGPIPSNLIAETKLEEGLQQDDSDRFGTDNEPKDTSYWLEKRHNDLMSEPKDGSWAYYMEQAIFQFLSNHPRMSEFDVSYIECRTTTCQIQVVGFDQSTGPTWQRIMYDFQQQLPDQFYESGWTGFDLDGRAVFVQKLKRN